MNAFIRCAIAAIALLVPVLVGAQAEQPAATVFDKLKSMAGDWIDVDGSMGMKDKVAASYRVTGGGNAVVETLFGGTPMEMTTVYSRDGSHVVLTHYCAAGNQPRMRAVTTDGTSLVFEFDGGSNLDPAKDGHMHNGRIHFVSPGRMKAQWYGWDKGKPSAHMPAFNLARKAA